MFETATSILSVIDYIARRYYIYPPNNFLPDGSVKGKRNQNFPLKVSDIYFCYVESNIYSLPYSKPTNAISNSFDKVLMVSFEDFVTD